MFIDTHTHLDGDEFATDRAEVMARAREAGVGKVFLPAIDIKSTEAILDVCRQYPGYAYPMVGLHPEEVRADWRDVLAQMKQYLKPENRFIAIGEVGLDYYWSREFEQEQLDAFEEQVKWSVETRLPLMIHCRKGQNEMVQLLRRYKNDLPGGVFHCFTGKDRTGILAALILGVCGASTEDIAADYSVSQLYLRPMYRWMRENIPDFAARAENAPFFSTAGENILAVCDHLENEYGGAERFLRECGVGADTLDALRRRMIKKA